MLLSDAGADNEIILKIVSPEGLVFSAYFSEDCLIEDIKNRAINYFYPNGEIGSSRYKMIRVSDAGTLHELLSLAQEQLSMQEELLLIERRNPEAGTLWDLGSVRAPQPGAIAAATSALPAPQDAMRQPNLQSLLSTNDLSYELRKILISLIEAGARLAAAGRNYEATLSQLTAALDERKRFLPRGRQVITPEDLAFSLQPTNVPNDCNDLATDTPLETEQYKRAEYLQIFLEKFRTWRMKLAEPPNEDAVDTLRELGFADDAVERALKLTGSSVPAAATWLVGERGSSIFELTNGLPDGLILKSLLNEPQIQRGLLNTRMLLAFIAMVGQTGNASLWLNSPHGSSLLSHISRTYHAEKYCLAVNQFSDVHRDHSTPSTSRQRH